MKLSFFLYVICKKILNGCGTHLSTRTRICSPAQCCSRSRCSCRSRWSAAPGWWAGFESAAPAPSRSRCPAGSRRSWSSGRSAASTRTAAVVGSAEESLRGKLLQHCTGSKIINYPEQMFFFLEFAGLKQKFFQALQIQIRPLLIPLEWHSRG